MNSRCLIFEAAETSKVAGGRELRPEVRTLSADNFTKSDRNPLGTMARSSRRAAQAARASLRKFSQLRYRAPAHTARNTHP